MSDQWPEWADEIISPITGRAMYYSINSEPISFRTWAEMREDHKRIALTEITSEIAVSTVWLGIDHGWGQSVPIIFEMMVFGGPLDQEQWRYATKEAALAGHDQAVAAVRTALRDKGIDPHQSDGPEAPDGDQ